MSLLSVVVIDECHCCCHRPFQLLIVVIAVFIAVSSLTLLSLSSLSSLSLSLYGFRS